MSLLKITPKWTKDLNIRLKTIKFLRDAKGKKILGIGLGNEFLQMTPKPRQQNKKTGKWNCIKKQNKTKSKTKTNFHTAKETANKVNREPME